jgi:hypothetical protein
VQLAGFGPLESEQEWDAHATFTSALEKEGFILLGRPLEGTSPSKAHTFGGVMGREDTNVLAFGTFRTDETESFLRVDEVLTFNKLMPTLGRF